MIRLAVAGAAGRMGRCILDLAACDERFAIAAALTAPGCAPNGVTMRIRERDVEIVERLESECDVLIDFSTPAGTMAWLNVCQRRKIPMVIGVTGHDEAQLARVRQAAHQTPIVFAANFSVGMNAVLGLLGPLVRALGDGYDVEIVETHHRFKTDAPSGTALAIVDEIQSAAHPTRDRGGAEIFPPCQRGTQGGSHGTSSIVGGASLIFGRHGRTGERPAGQIAVHSVRMGDVVGRHEIHFSACGETITIRHTAHSRETFAAGALRAAVWIVAQRPGLYTMRDVLRKTDQRGDRK